MFVLPRVLGGDFSPSGPVSVSSGPAPSLLGSQLSFVIRLLPNTAPAQLLSSSSVCPTTYPSRQLGSLNQNLNLISPLPHNTFSGLCMAGSSASEQLCHLFRPQAQSFLPHILSTANSPVCNHLLRILNVLLSFLGCHYLLLTPQQQPPNGSPPPPLSQSISHAEASIVRFHRVLIGSEETQAPAGNDPDSSPLVPGVRSALDLPTLCHPLSVQ